MSTLGSPHRTRNRRTFAIGTTGRDMVYALQSMFLVVYLTEAMHVSNWVLGAVTVLILAVRLLDAAGDILVGAIVDNTRTRWGPLQAVDHRRDAPSGLATILLFTDFGLQDAALVAVFSLAYVVWSFSWKRFSRKQLYTGAMATIVAAYVLFFFSPMNIVMLCLCGLMLFVADSFIVILMIGFITDCVEYGQRKR